MTDERVATEIEAPIPGVPVRGSETGRPIMAALDLLGRRGALRILWELREGRALSFRALASATGLPPGTLNSRIKELRVAGVVEPAGIYRLTGQGSALLTALWPLVQWSEDWAKGREMS
ncbi:DNA-binding HxlR family transcriptional regulator [Caulobacter ginsengisoli]|uniref:DNA-binding HxlR family transcriptional regulator n=1 Tax=Caulobacter ginsengisoli TaxID=400775 RepID=A0ABU0IQF7_9CAUL|nr:winged helix-turn-helix transcriptional regulator [Caulobacter ginsengisoli]MDQ0463576.1 DNA-binding HxlR family transcriptional regulator [Caulobacter ginsengisoli]